MTGIDGDAMHVDGVRGGRPDGDRAGHHAGRVDARRTTGRWPRRCSSSWRPHAGASQRVGITGVPGVGKSTFIDAVGTMLTGPGPPRRRARRRPVVDADRRQHPRRQDAHGAPGPGSGRLRPPVADVGHARRRDAGDARGDRRGRGGGLRRRARGDGRGRPVRGRRGRDGRHVPRAAAGPQRRLVAGHQEGCAGAGRRAGRQQGRRHRTVRTPSRPPSSWPARCTCWSRRRKDGRRRC